jgi:arylsulfatase A
VPLFRSPEFENRSLRGIYGDVVEEVDWSMGMILEKLRATGLDKNTLVIFTSDNGPWLLFKEFGGSAGLLRGGKGSTFEGGLREPAIFYWPGKLKSGVVSDMGSTLDILPTLCHLAGISLPQDRIYDGDDLSPVLFGQAKSKRDIFYYYRDTEVFAIRKGSFKAHFKTQDGYGSPIVVAHDPPLLYNLDVDPSEQYDVAASHPEVIEEMKKLLKEHNETIIPVENQIEKQ